ncbi:hypothetical protein PLICRDRAFT_176247 [Plicaturopsis crispa FD-325 SS-3]|nr:hypothetical protein PLICRDRAFT_176247 [Plicaturopsis crispa FD-325 SS-3]
MSYYANAPSNVSTYGGSQYGGHRSHGSIHARGPSPAPPIYSSGPSRHASHRSHSGYQQGPPAGADPQLWQWFSAVDVDRSGAISLHELQSALVNGNWTKFDLDTIKASRFFPTMLMNIFDTDRSGTIGFNEFTGLWNYVSEWQRVFRHFDRDRSGTIEGGELAEALNSFGYNLSPTLLTLLEQKYTSGPVAGYGPPPGITFDRFVRACVVVKTLTESFQRADTDRNGWVQFNYEQFMQIVLSAP